MIVSGIVYALLFGLVQVWLTTRRNNTHHHTRTHNFDSITRYEVISIVFSAIVVYMIWKWCFQPFALVRALRFTPFCGTVSVLLRLQWNRWWMLVLFLVTAGLYGGFVVTQVNIVFFLFQEKQI